MNKSQAIRFAGSQAALARLLGVTPSAVSQWPEKIPPLQVYRLKELKPRWFARLRREARRTS
jgi:DNA-binding transcriptional regulator YdaS (Cro superfamily)